MKTRLTRISPGNLGLLFGFIGLIASIPIVIFAFLTIGPGRTVNLNGGFLSLTFTGSLEPVGLVLAFPFLNAIAGVVVGFLMAWLYNLYARLFGGISGNLEQT